MIKVPAEKYAKWLVKLAGKAAKANSRRVGASTRQNKCLRRFAVDSRLIFLETFLSVFSQPVACMRIHRKSTTIRICRHIINTVAFYKWVTEEFRCRRHHTPWDTWNVRVSVRERGWLIIRMLPRHTCSRCSEHICIPCS